MDPRFHLLSEITLPLSFSNTFTAGSSSSGFSQDDPWMNPRIWSRLPTRILDRVIAFLLPPAFFRSLCVCRKWYGLLFSDSFLQLYLRGLQPRRRWFLFFKSNEDAIDNNNNRTEGYLFDPYELVWYHLPFPMVPPSLFSPAASSGGLVCWMSDNPAPKTLLLVNPLSPTVNQLPPTLTSRYQPSISFTVTRTAIDVSLAGDDLVNKAMAVKNSTAERFRVDGTGLFLPTWKITSPLPRLCSFNSGGRMVHLHGRIYNMSYHPFTVTTYDVDTALWWEIQPPLKRFLKHPSLMRCVGDSSVGKLLFVAAIEKRSLIVPKSLRIWRLQDGGRSWAEMERMPQVLYERFEEEIEACGNGFHCVGHTVRDPMLAMYFFLIDVSMNAIQTRGTTAACTAISQVIYDLPEGPRTCVRGVTTTFFRSVDLNHHIKMMGSLLVAPYKNAYNADLRELNQHSQLWKWRQLLL